MEEACWRAIDTHDYLDKRRDIMKLIQTRTELFLPTMTVDFVTMPQQPKKSSLCGIAISVFALAFIEQTEDMDHERLNSCSLSVTQAGKVRM